MDTWFVIKDDVDNTLLYMISVMGIRNSMNVSFGTNTVFLLMFFLVDVD